MAKTILNQIGDIYEHSFGCRLDHDFFVKADKDLELLSEYFSVSKQQTLMISVIISLQYNKNTVSMAELINHFKCTPVKLLEYHNDFETLQGKGILYKTKGKYYRRRTGNGEAFSVNEKVVEAIINNRPMPTVCAKAYEDVFALLEDIYHLAQKRDDEEISTKELLEQSIVIIKNNTHYPLVKEIDSLLMNDVDKYLYALIIWESLSGKSNIDLEILMSTIIDSPAKKVRYMQLFMNGKSPLIKSGLCELEDGGFFNDSEIKLTDLSMDLLKKCGLSFFNRTKKSRNVILPGQIQQRELVFDENEMNQLIQLKNLLCKSRLKQVQKRLSETKLPIGITAIFHGSPGTGKTEAVLQIAREMDYEVIKVDISHSKSMWFGQSEKLIKKIFTDYEAYAKESEYPPILFFNEADAIFSKRKAVGHSNIAQTENTIQNIILEEMESFPGILIATTNLIDNLDPAFERRFLFKILFQKPNATIRGKIWKQKLPHLSLRQCNILAEKHEFSGAQIDNIVRKNEIQRIVAGKTSGFEDILAMCSEESLTNAREVVGYRRVS